MGVSDSYLRVIPDDPTYVPGAASSREAERRLVDLLPEAAEVIAHYLGEVQFVDCGEGLEHIFCPSCRCDLAPGRVWQRLMDTAYTTGFCHLAVVLPCCGAGTSLNRLDYQPACGFASYKLEARGPYSELGREHLSELASVLGCGVRAIYAHY
jgi:hypothetical protein